HATKTLRQGERAYAALVWPRSRHSTGKEYWAEHPAPPTAEEAFQRVERTADFWREWINRGEFPEHPWQSFLQRSALTLKWLTYNTVDHPRRYASPPPVPFGNAAFQQVQHDVWGAVLDSVYLHTKSRDFLPEVVWPILKRAVESAIENWQKPDRGIWEVRGEPQHFVSSKLMCWVACDRGARLA